MEDAFELPVMYKGKEILFSARLLKLGYIYKIEVDLEGVLVHFEKDDERNWRAVVNDPIAQFEKKLDRDLLSAVIATIEEVTGS
jgi:hypothetical protein